MSNLEPLRSFDAKITYKQYTQNTQGPYTGTVKDQ